MSGFTVHPPPRHRGAPADEARTAGEAGGTCEESSRAASNGSEPRRHARLEVGGIVHGVGFHPFTCRLARELGLDGTVRTVGDQVLIDAAGPAGALSDLHRRLLTDAPAPARVSTIGVAELNGDGPQPGTGFRSVVSPVLSAGADTGRDESLRLAASRLTGVPRVPAPRRQSGAPPAAAPERPVCADCVREMFDPRDRRYRYPFVSCARCGPASLPGSTHTQGQMCRDCQADHDEATGRRFQAGFVACPACGPLPTWREGAEDADQPRGHEAVSTAVERIEAGGVVAVKGPGGYQLVCAATVPRAVARLRAAKGSWTRPLAVLAGDLASARSLAWLSSAEERLLVSSGRPTVLVRARPGNVPLAAGTNPGTDRLGLMLPFSPLQHLLVHDVDRPLVITSGNRTDEPRAIDDADALARLAAFVDGFLLHDLPVLVPHEESVGAVVGGRPVVVRRGRGQVPGRFRLRHGVGQPVLAVGSQREHTFAVAIDDEVTIGGRQGDLSHASTMQVFEDGLAQIGVPGGPGRALPEPGDVTGTGTGTGTIVAHDLHPGYLSSQYAARWPDDRRIAVQHHHAHVASCAAEHELDGPFIGVAYDGLGLGDDGTFWGGEVLIADLSGYRRVGRFGAAPLPGGEAAVRRPARLALGYLLAGEQLGGAQVAPELVHTFTKRLSVRELDTVRRMLHAGGSSPVGSSAAQLIAAVASLLGLRDDATYHDEPSVAVEAAARGLSARGGAPELPWRIVSAAGLRVYDPVPTLAAVLAGVADGAPTSMMAAGLHATFATVTAALCVDARRESGLHTVCVSGECLTNGLLASSVVGALRAEGFDVFLNERIPTNDGGISFGQAAVAAARLAKGPP
ncbi:Sua5/YciO/YrdC/YwlC family protein [Actinopolymorpha sp. B9G3]|uniref:Kae1-like domain-containing protein n=1 Tax=Actinopolymorpha sp. B9G3 TaxID=3158970 RepID=UPI0032D99348